MTNVVLCNSQHKQYTAAPTAEQEVLKMTVPTGIKVANVP